MSNQLRKGIRNEKNKNNKKAKLHYKYAKKIIDTLDIISELIYNKNITEDNIESEVSKVSDITLGSMEKNYILKQISIIKNEKRKNI